MLRMLMNLVEENTLDWIQKITFKSKKPLIIFLLHLMQLSIYPRFTHSKIVLNVPDNISGIYPSDHPAVLTTLHDYA